MMTTNALFQIAVIEPDNAARQGGKPRRMARPAPPGAHSEAKPKAPSKLDQVEALLLADEGTTIADIMAATGWQQHSVRGAIAGALKKRGLLITSDKIDGIRRYRASKPA